MSSIHILIIEDEAIVAEDIAARLELNGYLISGIVDCAESALKIAASTEVDIALVDISIKGPLTGIQTAALLQTNYGIPIIYLTALSDDATLKQVKKTRPSAYLLKPFREKELLMAIEMAYYNMAHPTVYAQKEEEAIVPDLGGLYRLDDRVFIRNNNRFEKIFIDDILWIEAKRSYCEIMTVSRKFIISQNLHMVCSLLNLPTFLRIHRSYLVNTKKIESFEGNTLLVGERFLPIGKKYRSALPNHFKFL